MSNSVLKDLPATRVLAANSIFYVVADPSGTPTNYKIEASDLAAELALLSPTTFVLRDGSRAFSAPIDGVTPTAGSHLSTKSYVDGGDAFAQIVWSFLIRRRITVVPLVVGHRGDGHGRTAGEVDIGDAESAGEHLGNHLAFRRVNCKRDIEDPCCCERIVFH